MLEDAKGILQKYYGYQDFRAGQQQIITNILQGNDTVAVMPTGAGKSLCFQIPAQLFPGVTLVISPLISLMKDQVDSLHTVGIPATYINSSLKYSQVEVRLEQARHGRFKLIYIAPERLQSPEFRRLLQNLRVSLVAVDEAHCVSQWGHDFRPSYRGIAPVIKELASKPVVAAFTATATNEVKNDVIRLLLMDRPGVFVTGFNRSNLFFSVIKNVNKKDFVLDYIRNNSGQAGIIYAGTRKEVDSLCQLLQSRGFQAGRYHAGLTDAERTKNQEAFLYDDILVMVATNAFGMGIDKSNIRYVLHHNLPKSMEAYYQEAGRAGRDGEPGECILLFESKDIMLQKFLIEQTSLNPDRKNKEYEKLQEMVDYCHTQGCLRKYILNYFGEEDFPERCNNCGSCNDETELQDITIDAQKILSCIYRMKGRFGITLVAQVLKGSKNKKLLQLGLHRLSTYGIMSSSTEKEIKDTINVLIAEGYAEMTEGRYPVLSLGKKAVPVLKSREKVYKRIPKQKEKIQQDDTLFEILRRLRKEIADREKIPPYIIFPDSALREMSSHCPTEPASMLKIKGVGEYKLQKYGELFIEAIAEYLEGRG